MLWSLRIRTKSFSAAQVLVSALQWTRMVYVPGSSANSVRSARASAPREMDAPPRWPPPEVTWLVLWAMARHSVPAGSPESTSSTTTVPRTAPSTGEDVTAVPAAEEARGSGNVAGARLTDPEVAGGGVLLVTDGVCGSEAVHAANMKVKPAPPTRSARALDFGWGPIHRLCHVKDGNDSFGSASPRRTGTEFAHRRVTFGASGGEVKRGPGGTPRKAVMKRGVGPCNRRKA